MRDILRGELGFDGVLISDFAAIKETIAHGYSENGEKAAENALRAGVDIDMMTTTYLDHVADLIQKGVLKEELLDESVMRILELKNRLGLFENPYKDADEEKEKELFLCQAHRKAARKAGGAILCSSEKRRDPACGYREKNRLYRPLYRPERDAEQLGHHRGRKRQCDDSGSSRGSLCF